MASSWGVSEPDTDVTQSVMTWFGRPPRCHRPEVASGCLTECLHHDGDRVPPALARTASTDTPSPHRSSHEYLRQVPSKLGFNTRLPVTWRRLKQQMMGSDLADQRTSTTFCLFHQLWAYEL